MDPAPPITSRKNPRLRTVRTLVERRGRRRLERFLLEGPKAILEALEGWPEGLEQVLYRAGAEERPQTARALDAAAARGVPCFAVAPALFDELAQVTTPQPLLAVGRQRWADLDALLGVADPPRARAVVALVGVQDPGNVGTILRTAAFFGFAGALFPPGAQDPWSPKVVRASAGTLLAHPPGRLDDPAELLGAAERGRLVTAALVAHGGEPFAPERLPGRLLLLLGAEGGGLPAELEARVERRLTIAPPRAEPAESLNVAVAFGVAAHAWATRHAGAP